MSIFASNDTAGETKVKSSTASCWSPSTNKLDLEFGVRACRLRRLGRRHQRTRRRPSFTFRATDGLTLARRLLAEPSVRRTRPSCSRASRCSSCRSAPSDPCSFTTTRRAWARHGASRQQPEPRRQFSSCAPRSSTDSDTDPGRTTTSSVFDLRARPGPNGFARTGQPVLPARDRAAQGQRRTCSPRRARPFTLGVSAQGPGSLENLTASFDCYDIEITGRDCAAELAVRASAVLQRQRHEQSRRCRTTATRTARDDPAQRHVRRAFVGRRAVHQHGCVDDLGPRHAASTGSQGRRRRRLVLRQLVVDVPRRVRRAGRADARFRSTRSAPVGAPTEGGQYRVEDDQHRSGTTSAAAKPTSVVQWRYLPDIKDESAARNPTTLVFPVDCTRLFNLFAGYAAEPTRSTCAWASTTCSTRIR